MAVQADFDVGDFADPFAERSGEELFENIP